MLPTRFDQPFYVPAEKRHLFRGVNSSGYLPPLELPPEPDDNGVLLQRIDALTERVEKLETNLILLRNSSSKSTENMGKRTIQNSRGIVL